MTAVFKPRGNYTRQTTRVHRPKIILPREVKEFFREQGKIGYRIRQAQQVSHDVYCVSCAKIFPTFMSETKYCSNACRQKAWRDRHRNKIEAP